ncbi:TPA: hypothetical protein HA278_04545 [Candidatus Woesearchaeota archaeon]|nr:hypothetical protein [Candidatus Woesearchaeota archaeon]
MLQKIKFALFWRSFKNTVRDVCKENHFPSALIARILASLEGQKQRTFADFRRCSGREFLVKAAGAIDTTFNMTLRKEYLKFGIRKDDWIETRNQILAEVVGDKHKELVVDPNI